LDRKAISKAVYGDLVEVPQGPYLGGSEFVSPDIKWYSYDPDKARALLEEAEADGWDMDQELSLLTFYGGSLMARAGALMQQYWAEVGITVDFRQTDSATWSRLVREGDDWWMAYQCSTGMPEISSVSHLAGGTYWSHYSNEEVDRLIPEGEAELDPEKRKIILQELSVVFFNDPPNMPTWSVASSYMVSKDLCNYRWRKPWLNSIETHPNTWYLATAQ
jgi:peptide/nickel transport system substrate-binding protein